MNVCVDKMYVFINRIVLFIRGGGFCVLFGDWVGWWVNGDLLEVNKVFFWLLGYECGVVYVW